MRLEELQAEHPRVVRDVRGAGPLLSMELRPEARRGKTGDLHPAWKRVEPLWIGLRQAGIQVTTNNDGSSLLLCPPFIVTEAHIDRLIERLDFHLHSV